jgi:hypothetical protein
VEDIVELLARQALKKIKEAQARSEAAGQKPRVATAAIARPRRAFSVGPNAAPANAPSRPAVPRPAAPPAAAASVSAAPVIERIAPPMKSTPLPASPLLAAFGGGATLLAGIVLAEALAPPVALRESQLFDRIER